VLDNNQDDNNSKKLTKIAIETLQRLQKETQQPQSQVNFKQDELEKLNKFFIILNSFFKDNFEFKKLENVTKKYKIRFVVNIKKMKDMMTNKDDSIISFLNTTFDNLFKILSEHTSRLNFLNWHWILNNRKDNEDIQIEIEYNNLDEFLALVRDQIDYFEQILSRIDIDYKQNFKSNNLYNLIITFKEYFDNKINLAKEEEEYIEISKYFKKFIYDVILLIDSKKHYEIRKNEGGSNMLYLGGNLNDKLKIKYLDTRKYKDLKKTKTEGEPDELEPYKIQKYDDDDDDDDMNKIGQLSDDIDEYYNSTKDKKDKDKFIIQQINNFENDPKNPLEELAITFDDRIVFIIATFFIRYITIIMVQWCIDINIIKTFYEGFIYYAIIYIIIFWFIVLFINIDNSFDVKYMNFNGIINTIRTLFYYFYMGTNGITRLLIHTSLIILLIIIPIILNIKNKTEFKDENEDDDVKILNYEERKQLSKSLSLFTMFIWLFTSIIATKF